MVKKIFITTTIFFLCCLLNSQVSATNDESQKLYVSPIYKIVKYSDTTAKLTEEIIVTNSLDTKSRVSFSPVLISFQSGEAEIIQDLDNELIHNISFPLISDTIEPRQEKKYVVNISNPADFKAQIYPGVMVKSTSEENIQEGVTFESRIISLFLTEKTDAKLSIGLSVNISEIITLNDAILVKGTITNTGEKIYSPTGSIRLYKNNKRLGEYEISTQICKHLLPNQSVEFKKRIKINNFNYIFTDSGQYLIETIVRPTPYDSFITDNQLVWLVHPGLLIVSPFGLFIIVFAVILIIKKSKRKPTKK